MVLRGRLVQVLLWLTVLTCTAAAPALAQQSASDDDDAKVQPAEPDYRLINLPSNLRLPVRGMAFGLTHRFAGNLRDGTFGHQLENLFGLDSGAIIGLEFRYGIARHVQAIVFRTNYDKTIQFSGKWDPIRQGPDFPLSISAVGSVEGVDNFRKRYSPALGAVVAHTIKQRLALYATPTWVHNTAEEAQRDEDTFFVGLAARARFGESTYVVGEFSPRVTGSSNGDPEYGFGIEKRVGGHSFQLNFTNTFGTTFGQLARGGFPDTLYLGFNLARKFF